MFSVIVTSFKEEKYIKACLESLSTQGLSKEDLEVIVLNDCSPDNTPNIIEDFVKKQKDIDFKFKMPAKNGGVAKLRNMGLEEARGRFVTFVDGDDFLEPYALANIKDMATATKADLIVPQIETHYDEGVEKSMYECTKVALHQSRFNRLRNPDDFYVSVMENNVRLTAVCSTIVSKNIIDENNLRFKDTLDEDTMWSVNIYPHVKKPKLYTGSYYYYRQHGVSRSTENLPGIFEQKIKSVEDILQLREENPNLKNTLGMLADKQEQFVIGNMKVLSIKDAERIRKLYEAMALRVTENMPPDFEV